MSGEAQETFERVDGAGWWSIDETDVAPTRATYRRTGGDGPDVEVVVEVEEVRKVIDLPARLAMGGDENGDEVEYWAPAERVGVTQSVPVVRSLCLYADAGRSVPSKTLRSLALENIARDVMGRLAHRRVYNTRVHADGAGAFKIKYEPLSRAEGESAVRNLSTGRRSGRPPVPVEELERAANVYREYIADSRGPLYHVRELLGLSERTASRRIEQARAAGLLPPTTPGKRRA